MDYERLGFIVATIALIVSSLIAIVAFALPYFFPNPQPTPDFSLTVNPLEGRVMQGGMMETTITVKSINGYKNPVSLSANGQPTGIAISFIPPLEGSASIYASKVTEINRLGKVVLCDYLTLTRK